jgi:hypothetical protein
MPLRVHPLKRCKGSRLKARGEVKSACVVLRGMGLACWSFKQKERHDLVTPLFFL